MYAVIFKAHIRELDPLYHETVQRMRELAMQQYGCIEFLSFTEGDQEISISYWETQEHIRQWKQNAEHFKAQALGKSMWYHAYQIEVVEIIRKYTHPGGKP